MVPIDTHVLIWALYDPEQLSVSAMKAIRDNDCCVSIASLWEMSVKMAKGRLKLRESIMTVAERCQAMGVEILPITPEHCERFQGLPKYHKDPFDRMIVAQSLAEGYTLVTKDENIRAGYDMIEKIW